MNTPIAPSDEEPIEATVRQLLWRLRARLVTPPVEDRSVADLDRLLAAARLHAHEAPVTPLHVEEQPSAEVVPLRTRRFEVVGRAAAAMVLLVAVGGGIANVRDGSITIDTLLGRTPSEPSVAAPTATDAFEAPELSGPEPEASVEGPSGSAEAEDPTPSSGEPAAVPSEIEAEAVPAEPRTSETEAEPDASAPDTVESAPSAEPANPPAPKKPTRSLPAPPEVEIIAAPLPPPPSTTDGSGGQGGCPDPVEGEEAAKVCVPIPDAPTASDAVAEKAAADALDELTRNRADGTVREP
jgi:hypothetical protein